MKYLLLMFTFLLFVVGGTSCSDGVDREPIELTPSTYSDGLKELGNGVFVAVPSQFRKARSFAGYQYVNGIASISLKIKEGNITGMKRFYDDDGLTVRGDDLLEMHPVNYRGNENAFFSITHNKRKHIHNYMLAIEEDGKVYNIKAIGSDRLLEAIDMGQTLEDALMSTDIRGYQRGPTDFARAIESDLIPIFTRDGKFPTESADSAVVIGSSDPTVEAGDDMEILRLAKNILLRESGDADPRIKTMTLANGSFTYGTGVGEPISAYVGIISIKGAAFVEVFTGTAKTETGVDNISAFVEDQVVTRKIRTY